MKAKIRLSFLLIAVLALAFGSLSPAQADEEPPAVRGDIIYLNRVMDLWPGSESSSPLSLAVYTDMLFFNADGNNGMGRELWIYDPDNPLTPMGIDINPGNISSFPFSLTVYNGALYFGAIGGDGAGHELWKFDFANGAQRVADINPGSGYSQPEYLAVYGTRLFFAADGNNGRGRELWIYDSAIPVGPTNPTVYDVCPGTGSSTPGFLAQYNGKLYFQADGCDGAGTELWKYDPTNGAQRVGDINPGSGSSYCAYMTEYNGALYFMADGKDGAGKELWMYDEVNDIQRAADILPWGSGSDPKYLEVYNGALYFSATGADRTGNELWKYDPVNGADLVADLHLGSGNSNPAYMTVYKGALYFSADSNDGTGWELWKYDNTATAAFRPSKPYDGWVLESGENTNAGGTLNAAQTTFTLGDDAQNKQYRSILSFNTSTLPDNAVVISATLRIRKQGAVGTNPFTTHGTILIDIIKGTFGTPALQITDFQAAPGRAGAGIIRNLPDANLWFTSTLSKLAFPHINKAGITQLRLRFTRDDNNDNGADLLRFFSADSASIGDYPVLEVKYYIP